MCPLLQKGEIMSSVHKRLRKETELQFMKTAWDLQIELTKFVMKEKNLPKKWRLIIACPIIEKVDELVDNLNYANCIYPTCVEDVKLREKYQQKAIANCWQLQNKLVRMIECVETVKIEKMENIINLLSDCEILIKKWRKSDKERNKKLFAV